jgi:hypothetical protein
MKAEPLRDEGMTQATRDAVVKWLTEQGVSTVLLVAILAFLGYAAISIAPEQLREIQDGYERVANTAAQNLKESTDRHAESIQSIIDAHDRDREMFLKLLELQTSAGAP